MNFFNHKSHNYITVQGIYFYTPKLSNLNSFMHTYSVCNSRTAYQHVPTPKYSILMANQKKKSEVEFKTLFYIAFCVASKLKVCFYIY